MVLLGLKHNALVGALVAMLAGQETLALPLQNSTDVRGASIPQSIWDANASPFIPTSARTLRKRGMSNQQSSVKAGTYCRAATNADLAGLNDAQLQTLINNANAMFDKPLVTLSNVRTYRAQMFYGYGGGGYNGRISTLRSADIVQYGQDGASICLDGSDATLAFNGDTTCNTNILKTYGTLGSSGSTATVSVTQGYLIDASVTSETSSGTNWEVTSSSSNSDESTFVFMNSDDISGGTTDGTDNDFFTALFDFKYDHIFNYGTESTDGSSSGTSSSNGGQQSSSSSTTILNEQNFQSSVSVTISPPAGSTCYIDVNVQNCKGSANVVTPVAFPSGMLLVYFPLGACLNPATDPTCAQGSNQYWYIPVQQLLAGYTPSTVVDTINVGITAAGQYTERCDSNNITTPNGLSESYVPTLNCPANLGIKKGCSVTAPDYLGKGIVTGDTNVWAANMVNYTQSPGPGQNISFGQTEIVFNATTPYQSKSCTSLLQVVPPFSASFLPAQNTLTYPTDGSDIVGATYSVGYVSSCHTSQYGTCSVTNVASQQSKTFSWQLTSSVGSPTNVFTFSNAGNQWPVNDVLTFTVECSDVYGNAGGIESYQQALKGTIATSTLTAATSTVTLKQATKYLYTHIDTLYTSMVTPKVTSTMDTQTIYTATVYTGTTTLTNFGATSHTGKKTTVTQTQVTTLATPIKILAKTISPSVPTTTVFSTIKTSADTTVYTSTPKVTVFATPTSTLVKTKIVAPTACPNQKNKKAKRGVVSTTWTTDKTDTYMVTDSLHTHTNTLAATTTSTDMTKWATSTLKTTQTLYDPNATAYVTTVAKRMSTRVVDNYTNYKHTHTVTETSTSTPAVKTTRVTKTLPQATISRVKTVTDPRTLTLLAYADATTVTKLQHSTTKTATSTATVTASCA